MVKVVLSGLMWMWTTFQQIVKTNFWKLRHFWGSLGPDAKMLRCKDPTQLHVHTSPIFQDITVVLSSSIHLTNSSIVYLYIGKPLLWPAQGTWSPAESNFGFLSVWFSSSFSLFSLKEMEIKISYQGLSFIIGYVLRFPAAFCLYRVEMKRAAVSFRIVNTLKFSADMCHKKRGKCRSELCPARI